MSKTTQNAPHDTLDVEGLTCVRGARIVFSGLAFSIGPSSVTLLRGPNGAGKSSLLRILAGLLRPSTGALRWNGHDVNLDRENHRRRIRYAGHLDAIKPVLSVAENLYHWAAIYGVRPSPSLLTAAQRSMGLDGLGDLPARFLSAGQRRRLGLARLALSPGHLWLLDEPTVSLDTASVARLEAAIRNHTRNGGSALIATHGDLDIESPGVVTLDAPAAPDPPDV